MLFFVNIILLLLLVLLLLLLLCPLYTILLLLLYYVLLLLSCVLSLRTASAVRGCFRASPEVCRAFRARLCYHSAPKITEARFRSELRISRLCRGLKIAKIIILFLLIYRFKYFFLTRLYYFM